MRIIGNMKEQIAERLMAALADAKTAGALSYNAVPAYVIETPREKEHGDFATNLAMAMAKEARLAPRRIADIIIRHLQTADSPIVKVAAAGAGFINFYLDHDWLQAVPRVVAEMGDRYGSVDLGKGEKVQVEFVSANPTGLLHMGNARGGAIGDSLANLLAFAGYEVEREFYINDAGNQMRLFGESMESRYLQLLGEEATFPDDGYHGEDITATAQHYLDQYGDNLRDVASEERRQILADYAIGEKLAAIKTILSRYGIEYDVWFSERSLYTSGKLQETVDALLAAGHAYEEEGAILLQAIPAADGARQAEKEGVRQNLEEKDNVLVRANGYPTYFAADIAYHRDKFQRGFKRVIDIWGADHHGHVARMKQAVSLFGTDPDALTVILMQFVRMMRNGEPVKMSKRTGQYLTLEDLLEEVGYDAARYFFVMRNPDSVMDFDLELAKSQTADNPVFYVQYAHARICSILRQAEARGYAVPAATSVDYTVLAREEELALLKKIADLPEEIVTAAQTLEPHRLTAYLQELAATFHHFYNHCHVNVEDEPLRQGRLGLCMATATSIKNVLTLLGVSAPTEM